VTKNGDIRDLSEIIEDHNRRTMRGDFTLEERLRLRKLLEWDDDVLALARRRLEIDGAIKVYDRTKWIFRSIAVGAPILLALWQLFDRIRSK